MTVEQLEVLRSWGAGLEAHGASEELRAAGRAITLLIEELDAAQRAAWHDRVGVSDRLGITDAEPEPDVGPEEVAHDALETPLRAALRRSSIHRLFPSGVRKPAPQPGAEPEDA